MKVTEHFLMIFIIFKINKKFQKIKPKRQIQEKSFIFIKDLVIKLDENSEYCKKYRKKNKIHIQKKKKSQF